MDERLKGYDWANVFQYCGEGPSDDCSWVNGSANVSAALGSSAAAHGFSREDVAEVLALSEGENDGPNWLGVFRLRDGRYAYVSAGCDYTGWDCQASGYAVVAHSFEHLEQYGLDNEARQRLGSQLAELPKGPGR